MAFSTAVSRFFRAIRVRKAHEQNNEDQDYISRKLTQNRDRLMRGALLSVTMDPIDSMEASEAPSGKTVLLPHGFMCQQQRLVEQVKALTAASDSSSSSTNRQQKAVTKTLMRLQAMLEDQSNNEKKQSKSRRVTLFVAMNQVLTTWECVIKCLECVVQRSDSAASTAADRLSDNIGESDDSTIHNRTSQLETAACALLELLIQQPVFDMALMALGNGECDSHREGRGRKHSIEHDERTMTRIAVPVTMHRRNSRHSIRRSVNTPTHPPSTRGIFSSRKEGSTLTSDATLCQQTRRYLNLHQSTLVMFTDTAIVSEQVCEDSGGRTSAASSTMSHQSHSRNLVLLGHVLSESYVRVPAIRDAILNAFQQHIGKRARITRKHRKIRTRKVSISTSFRPRSSTLREDANVALFRWHQTLHPRCHGSMVPYSTYNFWCNEMELVTVALRNTTLQRVFLSLLFQDLMGSSTNNFDWKSLPGSITLKHMVLTVTADIYRMQLRAMERSVLVQQTETEQIESNENNSSKSLAAVVRDDASITLFMQQVHHLMSSTPSFIHEWMMAILENTNYMVPHHVAHCFEYLDQLMTRFPAYFQNESSQGQTGIGSTAVDTATLRRVFTCLLRSERFDILKSTLLFLLHRFPSFSMSMREELVGLFASQIRLFVHWHHDVRFCYYHVLIYLTYPGNRLVLCAKSDELLMGSHANQMFGIHGLVRRGESAAKWDIFDKPLTAMLTYVQWTLKQNNPKDPSKTWSNVLTTQGRKTMVLKKTSMRGSMRGPPKTFPNRYSMPERELLSISNSEGSCRQIAERVPLPPQAPAWIADVRFCVIDRSVQEYRTHIKSYYQLATQMSIHEAVPTPHFQEGL